MAVLGTKTFNWSPQPSAWQQAQAWREKRRAANEQFLSNAASFTSGFSAAFSNQVNGSSELAAQLAQARIQAQAKAKLASLNGLSGTINQLA